MDEKGLLAQAEATERRTYSAPSRRRLRIRLSYLAALVVIGLTVFVFVQPAPLLEVSTWSPMASKVEVLASQYPIEEVKTGLTKPVHTSGRGRPVPLEAHIMSKCPDAQECLHDLVMPAMQMVHDKVNFTLSYIGRPTADGGVECMHGPAECMGNILELCAQELYPDPKIFLGFTNCLFTDYPSIPEREYVEECALEYAIDIGALNECATRDDGQHGVDLLLKSVRRSSAAGVTKSCTVRLNNEIYCIRDDGEWAVCPGSSQPNDLVMAVEKLWRQQN